MNINFQQKLPLLFKTLVSVGLIFALLHYINLNSVVGLLVSADLTLISLGLVLAFLTLLLNCIRWKLCLLDDGRRIPFRIFLVSYWTSAFVGLGLPSEFGGDILRAKDMLDKLKSRINAIASIFWSRFSGLAATLFVFSLLGIVFYDRLQELSLTWLWLVVLVTSLLTSALILSPRTRRLAESILSSLPAQMKIKTIALTVLDRLHQLATHQHYAWKIYAYALLAFLVRIVTNTLYAWSLAIPVTVPDMAVVVTIVALSSMLPLSLAGIGIKEGAFVIGLTLLGISAEEAISVALLNRTVLLTILIFGGLMFPARHRLLKI